MLNRQRQRVSLPTCRVLNDQISDLSGLRPKEGMLFGLELELEGEGVALHDNPVGWKQVAEGSLRGEATEYVFSRPVAYDLSRKRVTELFKALNANGATLNASYRTSTHVHLNFSDKTPKQAFNFFLLHTVMEEVFERYCGDTRGGNLFCLSCRDNEELVTMLDQALFTYGNFNSFGNEVRYNACNLAALNKFGSVEIRTMRGADTPEQVLDWLDILNQLYVFACSEDCPAPWKLCENLSYLGAHGFLSQCFNADTVAKLLKTWPAALDLHRSLMNGVRLMQMLSYKLQESWEKPAPEGVPLGGEGPVFVKNFKREVRMDAPPIPVRREQFDRVVLPSGGGWWVSLIDRLEDAELLHVEGRVFRFSAARLVFYDTLTRKPLRWDHFEGEPVKIHSDKDMFVNREYYEWLDVEDEQNEEEEEEDGRRDEDY